jgi:hypothetical protein
MTPPAPPVRIGRLAAFQDGAALAPLPDRLVEGVAAVLARHFPEIARQHLRLPSVAAGEVRTSPLPRLGRAATEKLLHRCDVVLVLTDGLLTSRDRGFAYGAVSRELESLVVSLCPLVAGEGEGPGCREEGLLALLLTAGMPAELLEAWSGTVPDARLLLDFSLFAATLGVLAAVFGGNLEDEQEIEALLLIDREF